jgi:hypothetical protein
LGFSALRKIISERLCEIEDCRQQGKVVSLRVRHEQLTRLDFHQLDCGLAGRYRGTFTRWIAALSAAPTSIKL